MAIHRMLLVSAVRRLPVATAAHVPIEIKAERVILSPPVAGLSTAAIWKASGAGKRTVSCELSPHEPAPTATRPVDQPTGVASNPPIASDKMRAYRTPSLVVTVPCQNASPLPTAHSCWCAK